jgi:hypothetical protein
MNCEALRQDIMKLGRCKRKRPATSNESDVEPESTTNEHRHFFPPQIHVSRKRRVDHGLYLIVDYSTKKFVDFWRFVHTTIVIPSDSVCFADSPAP